MGNFLFRVPSLLHGRFQETPCLEEGPRSRIERSSRRLPDSRQSVWPPPQSDSSSSHVHSDQHRGRKTPEERETVLSLSRLCDQLGMRAGVPPHPRQRFQSDIRRRFPLASEPGHRDSKNVGRPNEPARWWRTTEATWTDAKGPDAGSSQREALMLCAPVWQSSVILPSGAQQEQQPPL